MSLNRRRAVAGIAALALSFGTVATISAGPAAAALTLTPAHQWGTNGRVEALLPVAGGKVIVGGLFSAVVDTAGRPSPAANLAIFDPATGIMTAFGSTNGRVAALAASGGTVYVGGDFTKVGGVDRTDLAALDGGTGALKPWAPSTNGVVEALVATAAGVYVGGSFLEINGVPGHSFVAKLDASTGLLDTTWNPMPNERVQALALWGSTLYLGGDFTAVGPKAASFTAAVSTQGTGAPIDVYDGGDTRPTDSAPVTSLATDGSRLYVGAAGAYVGTTGGACTALDAGTGAKVWSKGANGDVQAVQVDGGTIYCGGHFGADGSFDGQRRQKLAAVNAAGVLQGFAPEVNGALGVYAIANTPDHLYIGGEFTSVGSVAAQYFANFVDSAAQVAPLAPRLVSATAGDNRVTVAWDPPSSDGGSPIDFYRVYRKDSGAYDLGVKVPSGLTYTDPTAVNGTTYTYKVAAHNRIPGVGTGPASNELSATPEAGITPPPPPPPAVVPPAVVLVAAKPAAAPTDTTAPTAVLTAVPPANSASRSATISFTGTDPVDATASLKFRCAVDGAAAARCTSPLVLENLTDGPHSATVRAVDPAGNGSEPVAATWLVDVNAPSSSTNSPTAPLTVSSVIPISWSGSDTGSGVVNYDVRYARAAWNGRFGAWAYPAGWQRTAKVSLSAAAKPGSTYCYSTRARDAAGNLSAWSATRCSARALDDRALKAGSGWTRKTSKKSTGATGYYGKTYTASTRAGAVLTRTGVQTDRLALVATRCKACGTVGVYLNGKRLATVNLKAKTTQRRAMINLPRFSLRTTTVTIKVLTNGRAVQIDGLATSRR